MRFSKPIRSLFLSFSFWIFSASVLSSSLYAADDLCSKALSIIEKVRQDPQSFYSSENLDQVLQRLERTEARILARPEQAWWTEDSIQDLADLERRIAEGRVIKALDRPGVGISARMDFKYSTPRLDAAMDQIAVEFKAALDAKGLDSPQTKLVVTSILRTEEFQKELIQNGNPAAVRSSHTRAIAFDVSYRWFEENAPEKAAVLKELLEAYHFAGKINLIREELQGVWHIALSPSF